MRENKFRAWDASRKEWRAGVAIDENGDQFTWQEVARSRWAYVKLSTNFLKIVWHTGLKDKNGAEIYEGDIIDTHVKSGRYMKVYYNKECVSFMTAGLGDIGWVKTGGLGKDMCSYIEVIGNIYENPELLEKA